MLVDHSSVHSQLNRSGKTTRESDYDNKTWAMANTYTVNRCASDSDSESRGTVTVTVIATVRAESQQEQGDSDSESREPVRAQ